MSFFTLRIERHHLHDYKAQHAELQAVDIVQFVSWDDGQIYRLPTGEYAAEFEFMSAEDVRSLAYNAIKPLMIDEPEILCTLSNGFACSGLPVVSKADHDAYRAELHSYREWCRLTLATVPVPRLNPFSPDFGTLKMATSFENELGGLGTLARMGRPDSPSMAVPLNLTPPAEDNLTRLAKLLRTS